MPVVRLQTAHLLRAGAGPATDSTRLIAGADRQSVNAPPAARRQIPSGPPAPGSRVWPAPIAPRSGKRPHNASLAHPLAAPSSPQAGGQAFRESRPAAAIAIDPRRVNIARHRPEQAPKRAQRSPVDFPIRFRARPPTLIWSRRCRICRCACAPVASSAGGVAPTRRGPLTFHNAAARTNG